MRVCAAREPAVLIGKLQLAGLELHDLFLVWVSRPSGPTVDRAESRFAFDIIRKCMEYLDFLLVDVLVSGN